MGEGGVEEIADVGGTVVLGIMGLPEVEEVAEEVAEVVAVVASAAREAIEMRLRIFSLQFPLASLPSRFGSPPSLLFPSRPFPCLPLASLLFCLHYISFSLPYVLSPNLRWQLLVVTC